MKSASDEVKCIPGQMHYYLHQWVKTTQMMQPSFYSPLAPPREHYPVGTTTQIAKIFRNCFNTCQRAKGILPWHANARDTTDYQHDIGHQLNIMQTQKKLKASRQLSEEIFRLHFIIFHYHCFTDASGQIGPNSQLLPKICFWSSP